MTFCTLHLRRTNVQWPNGERLHAGSHRRQGLDTLSADAAANLRHMIGKPALFTPVWADDKPLSHHGDDARRGDGEHPDKMRAEEDRASRREEIGEDTCSRTSTGCAFALAVASARAPVSVNDRK